jgi:DNA (cytosine-5)-methyltransferase 1
MGVPQKRERVFFIGCRKDIDLPRLVMEFKETPVKMNEIYKAVNGKDEFISHSEKYSDYWNAAKQGHTVGLFNASCKRLSSQDVCYTIGAQGGYNHFHSTECRQLSKQEVSMIGTFPVDFEFVKIQWHYLIGMSVPPVMTAQIAHQIYLQWLSKIP